jgi:alcohol dehydrogenase (cytochrome c)
MQSSPISYELDGRQYIVTGSGGVLFAWALPERPAHARKQVEDAH